MRGLWHTKRLSVLAIGTILLFVRLALSDIWLQSIINIDLLHAICETGEQCTETQSAFTALRAPKELQALEPLSSCAALWQSRVVASESLDEAKRLLDKATACERRPLVTGWSGNLSWLEGDREAAIRTWQHLSPEHLIAWGRTLTLNGERDKGVSILTAVLQSDEEELEQGEAFQLFQNLGDFYRTEQNWRLAVRYYERAWKIHGGDFRIGLNLGTSYRQLGRLDDAISVLEEARTNVPVDRPYYLVAFNLELGQGFIGLGEPEFARNALDTAESILEEERSEFTPDELARQRSRLEHLKDSLRRTGG